MVYAVEAWTISMPDDEEQCDTEIVESKDFADQEEAMRWAWDRLEEGAYVKVWRR
jgi:hypothetical protein